jgi:predicted DNA-binding WGR domain protein
MNIEPSKLLRYKSGNSDKIWGYIVNKTANGQNYTFWGKVGGVIAFKAWDAGWSSDSLISNLAYAKRRKGYVETKLADLPADAQEKYEQAVVMATLGLLRIK